MVGNETEPPYDRPPLSKQVLTGARDHSQPKERLVAVYGRDGVATAVFAAGLPRKVMGSRDLLARQATYAEALDWARS